MKEKEKKEYNNLSNYIITRNFSNKPLKEILKNKIKDK